MPASTAGGIIQRSAALFSSSSERERERTTTNAAAQGIETRIVAEHRTLSRDGSGVIRRVATDTAPSEAAVSDAAESQGGSGLSSVDIDRIVAALERRVIAELERRGRRHRPGVF